MVFGFYEYVYCLAPYHVKHRIEELHKKILNANHSAH